MTADLFNDRMSVMFLKIEGIFMQSFSSARTSIRQIARPYTVWQQKVGFMPDSTILDYGGGRFDDAKDYMAQFGCKVLVFDPYNRTPDHNRKVMSAVSKKKPDYIVCANVLNVIKENAIVDDVIRKITASSSPNTLCMFSVYEGNGTGHGKQTGPDQYQRNQKTDSYIPMVKKYFPNVMKKYGLILATQ